MTPVHGGAYLGCNTNTKGNMMQDIDNTNEIDTTELIDSIETIVNALTLDPIAIGKIVALLSNKAYTAIQKIPYLQLKRYIDGVKNVEDELGEGCKLSDKLFSDPKKRNENAMRVYKMVTASDTEKKIDYLVDATRSMLLGLIDVEMMFRLFRVIADSISEDLEYLSGIIEKDGPFVGNIQIHALVKNGLVITAGIDPDADVEEQIYHISELGYNVDRYALSLMNDERQRWYKKRDNHKRKRPFTGNNALSADDFQKIQEIFEG